MTRYALRSLKVDELPLVETWLAAPHVARWYGETDANDIRDYLDQHWIEPHLLLLDGAPVGYMQTYRPHDCPLLDRHPYADLPAGTLGLDMLIGHVDLTGRGHGLGFIEALATDPLACGRPCLVADPSPENEIGLKAYRKAGFSDRGDERDTPWGRVRLLVRSLPCSDPLVTFLPVKPRDLPMLSDWLARPHWREWWGDPAEELSNIREMVGGRDTTKPYIFHIEGVPSGYIQVWSIGPHQTEEWARDNPWLMELPADSVGIDLSLADPSRLSHGAGTRVLRAFALTLRRAGHTTIIIDPDPCNGRAVAAYRKAGFSPEPHLEGRTEGVLIMKFQPDAPTQ